MRNSVAVSNTIVSCHNDSLFHYQRLNNDKRNISTNVITIILTLLCSQNGSGHCTVMSRSPSPIKWESKSYNYIQAQLHIFFFIYFIMPQQKQELNNNELPFTSLISPQPFSFHLSQDGTILLALILHLTIPGKTYPRVADLPYRVSAVS